MQLLCRQDDVFVGYGAIGVIQPPEGKDQEWLISHCWVCERTADEIAEAQA